MDTSTPIRLQVFLAHAGVASRRQAEKLIEQGRVAVNGQKVTILGSKVTPGQDQVTVNRKLIGSTPHQLEYYLVYKPVGVLSAAQGEWGRKAVTSLVPSKARLYPVGRLDVNSEGLILLTNDGDLTLKLTHPRYHLPKVYKALVVGTITPAKITEWGAGGQEVAGKKVQPMPIKLLSTNQDTSVWLEITLHEGRKRQIREVAKQFRWHVRRLIRVAFGPLRDSELQPGQSRPLTESEVTSLRQAVGQAHS